MTSPLTWAPLLAGLLFLGIFVVVEKRGAHPFFPIELFRNPGFVAAVGMGVAFNLAQAVGILQLANIWQYVYGFSTVEVSLGQLPVTIISVAASLYIGRRLSAGLSQATAIMISGGASLLGFLAFALILISHEFWFFLPGMLLIGFGMSGLVPYGALVLRLAPAAQFGAVTSSRTTIGQFGYAVGLSGSMVLVDALTRDGVIHRLKDAGVTPARYGEALDAIYAYTQNGTIPSGSNGTALLQGAAASYEVAFVTTMVVTAAIVGVLSLLTVIALRRFAAGNIAAAGTSRLPWRDACAVADLKPPGIVAHMTRTADHDESRAVEILGAAVRDARRRLGLSVQALAEKAGVSFGLVSQLERGLGNPSLVSIQRLAAALGVPAGQLMDEPAGTLAVVPASRRHRMPPEADVPEPERAVRELLTPRGESMLQLIRSTLPPGFSNRERPFRHIGTECVTVERGVLVVTLGDRRVELGEGDTVTYGCSEAHWWENGHDEVTVVLGAVTPFER
ncbi:MAG: helix-turn-helix domain-containing protein [Microbacterium sp.]|jgi:transcriptional regulator with XRE-family HTH domain|uniref:helix-turn-helix domain-containing protein n=1 Tax=Microbacterium TaxID=33882 RepID=UPI0025FB296B|nr:helix-turn-helix domain-containing protein [Microbacterium sp. UBA837]|tara:strand:+ start:5583 stop:7100 length:1518 start_codon:yes stop_codon:yes gene_type:complete